MAPELDVLPPQPTRRVVMRRVKARCFARIAVISAGAAAGVIALSNAKDSVVLGSAALLALAIMLVCAFVALFFAFTEEPREVEIVESSPQKGVIHLSGK